jgi:uncharacterized protein (DUF2062 family)
MGKRESKKNLKPKDLTARWKRWLRLFYLRILRLRGKPEEVAGGMAIGICIGLTPTVPLHMAIAVLIAFFLGKSKFAAALGCWVANPFMLPFVYLLDYKVGQAITGVGGRSLDLADFSVSYLLNLGWDITYPLFVGGAVVGLLSVFPSYLITKRLVILYRERRRKRLQRFGFPSQTA